MEEFVSSMLGADFKLLVLSEEDRSGSFMGLLLLVEVVVSLAPVFCGGSISLFVPVLLILVINIVLLLTLAELVAWFVPADTDEVVVGLLLLLLLSVAFVASRF